MNKYVGEFKKFINRGNVVDMSVGVIVGSAFTAIVTAMSNNILKPIVNFSLQLSLMPIRSTRYIHISRRFMPTSLTRRETS